MKLLLIIKIFIFLTLALFAFSLWQRMPDIDDAWIGEHAYWMAEKGYVKSELMHGITGQDVRHIVHHKFFTLNGAMFISLFGFSLCTIKSVSLLWLAVFLLVFIGYIKRTLGSVTAWFALMLTTINALVFQYSFVYRPEIMVMTLGFLSYLFLEKSIAKNNDRKLLIFSGLFAGIAAATHLNGLIFMAAGSVLLLWKHNFRSSLIFAVATLPAFAVYFYDFTTQYGISYWLYQINDSPALSKSSILPSSIAFAGKLFREHLRFFHSPKEITLSLLFLFMLIINYRELKKDATLLKYLLLLVIFLSLLAVHTTSKYILLYLPYMMLIIIRSFHHLYNHRKLSLKLTGAFHTGNAYKWSLGLIGLFIVVNTSWNLGIAMKKFNPEENFMLARKYMGNRTANLKILAPMTFIFNEIDDFKRIQSDLSITEMHKSGTFLYGKGFLHYADSLKLDYLIISDEYKDRLGLSNLKTGDLSTYDYVVTGQEQGLTIIAKRQQFTHEQH
ncbi:MAG: glycosyltransferase family 39 protein [Bacteroidales bacterium]|nr:glycosyltransferase family 39 protein [Bacteroidales bacterium]